MSALGFLGLGLFIIGILFAAYVVTHLDQIWNIFENVFGKIERYTEKMSVIPPVNADGTCLPDWDSHVTIQECALEIYKQNQLIIHQNAQILKNQEIIKCYLLLHKDVVYYGANYGGYNVTSNPYKVVQNCGK